MIDINLIEQCEQELAPKFKYHEDIALFKAHVGSGVKIKAAGGIKTLDDAQKFIELGADRLGTSKVVKAVKEVNYDGNSDSSY